MTALITEGSPQLKCITVEITDGMVGLKTLLPPACFPHRSAVLVLLDKASRAPMGGLCSTKACFLLSFLPWIGSWADSNLQPLLSKPWRMGKGTQPRSCQLCTYLLNVLAFGCVQCHCISFLQVDSHTNAHAHTLIFVVCLGSQKC